MSSMRTLSCTSFLEPPRRSLAGVGPRRHVLGGSWPRASERGRRQTEGARRLGALLGRRRRRGRRLGRRCAGASPASSGAGDLRLFERSRGAERRGGGAGRAPWAPFLSGVVDAGAVTRTVSDDTGWPVRVRLTVGHMQSGTPALRALRRDRDTLGGRAPVAACLFTRRTATPTRNADAPRRSHAADARDGGRARRRRHKWRARPGRRPAQGLPDNGGGRIVVGRHHPPRHSRGSCARTADRDPTIDDGFKVKGTSLRVARPTSSPRCGRLSMASRRGGRF